MITDINETFDLIDRINCEVMEYLGDLAALARVNGGDVRQVVDHLVDEWTRAKGLDMRPWSAFMGEENWGDPSRADYERRRSVKNWMCYMQTIASICLLNAALGEGFKKVQEEIFDEQVKSV